MELGFVVVAWLMVTTNSEASFIPFASVEACEVARAEMNRPKAWKCFPTGADKAGRVK